MADKVPVKGGYNGGSLTGIAEYATGDTLGVAHGGTGVVTIGSNQLLTGNGTSALTSESNLTFDGTILKATGDLCATVKVVSPALCIGSEYVLPTADGSAGQIMCTNGSGALAFATATAGVTLAGSTNNTIATVTGADALCGEANLRFDGTSLEIGPAATVSSSSNIFVVNGDTCVNSGMTIYSSGTSSGQMKLAFGNAEGADAGAAIIYSNSDDALFFNVNGATERMRIDSAGNVGIGTASPDQLLHIEESSGGDKEMQFQIENTGIGDAAMTYKIAAQSWSSGVDNNEGDRFVISSSDNLEDNPQLVITSAGKVSIGTGTPSLASGLFIKQAISGAAGGIILQHPTSGVEDSAAIYYDTSDGSLRMAHATDASGANAASDFEPFLTAVQGGNVCFACQIRINTTDDYTQVEIGSSDVNGTIRMLQSGNATVIQAYGWCTNYAGTIGQNIVGSNYSSGAYSYGGLDNQGSNWHMKIRSDGNGYIDQTWHNGGADYAEYWESTDGTRLDVGKTVVLDGNKVRYYNAEIDTVDDIFGVTRPRTDEGGSAGVIGNAQWSYWQGRYKTDDFGRWIKGDRVRLEWEDSDNPNNDSSAAEGKYSYYEDEIPEGVTPPADAVRTVEHVRIPNDDFDPTLEYVSREDRGEWQIIGIIGQIPIIATETVNPKWKKQRDISDATHEYYVG